ncbi:MAG TPA: hypothetical protein VJ464_21440 [Blastocatellia bacterium]|nr:hypothetical protein [Blastocatellia bacterium]
MAIKRRIEIKTHTHQVIKVTRRDTVVKGRCATCGQEIAVPPVEKPPRPPR